jgi:hypothetical protein
VLHPKVASRSCSDCQKWQYNEETGLVDILPGTDRPRPRPNPDLVPCRTPVGCPKGSPEAGIELTDQNFAAYEFHKECSAVNQWPEDAIVRRNASIIEGALASIERLRQDRLSNRLEAILNMSAQRR